MSEQESKAPVFHFVLTATYQPRPGVVGNLCRYGEYTMENRVTRNGAFTAILKTMADQAGVEVHQLAVTCWTFEPNELPA